MLSCQDQTRGYEVYCHHSNSIPEVLADVIQDIHNTCIKKEEKGSLQNTFVYVSFLKNPK